MPRKWEMEDQRRILSEIPTALFLSALSLPVLWAVLTKMAKTKGKEKLLLLNSTWGHPAAHDICFLA